MTAYQHILCHLFDYTYGISRQHIVDAVDCLYRNDESEALCCIEKHFDLFRDLSNMEYLGNGQVVLWIDYHQAENVTGSLDDVIGVFFLTIKRIDGDTKLRHFLTENIDKKLIDRMNRE